MNELEKIILNGTTLNLTDTTARTMATDAKQTADSASATATAAKQAADSASATATAAKQAADSALDSVLNITYDGTKKALVID